MREEKIKQLLNEILAAEKYNEYFLVDVKAPDQSYRVQVFLDGDNGISFNTCQAVSRELEATLDEADWIQNKYVLEVSSPGVKRSLVRLRQFPQHIGRKLKIELNSGEKFRGTLEDVRDNTIILGEEKRIKKGKSREPSVEEVEIDFDTIKETLVKLSFKK